MIALSDYLILSGVLFSLAVAGIFLNRKNVIILLMCIELMLLAVNTNFIAFGLAILVVLFRNRQTINVQDLDSLKG